MNKKSGFKKLFNSFNFYSMLNIKKQFFSDISERNNDYSDTLNFRRGEVGVVTFFVLKVLKVPDYESTMLIYFLYIYIYI